MKSLTTIQNKILDIHGQKVLLDRDLAGMYGVENRVLNAPWEVVPALSQKIFPVKRL